MTETLGSILRNACERYGDRTALVGRDGTRTYRQLLDRGSRLANALAGLGLQPGDHVAALLEDTVTAFETYIGCALGGFPIVHVNDRLVSREVDYILDNADARALVHTDGRTPIVDGLESKGSLSHIVTIGPNRAAGALDYEELLEKASARPALVDRRPEDLAILGYTSGTTGFPKGAMVTNRAVVGCIKLIPHAYRLPMYGRCAFTGTLSFVSGIWGVILPHLYLGGTVNFLFPYTIESWVEHMVANRSTFTYAPTPLVMGFVQEASKQPQVLDHLQTVLHSASAISPVQAKALTDLIGDRYVEVWGMTETVGPLTGTTRADWRGAHQADDIHATVGRPLATASVRVVDRDGNPLPIGETGELVTRCDTMFSGYYKNPEKTAEVLRDGEYFTGDLGRIDDGGYVYVTDRAKDMIISGGMNIYPAEVENALLQVGGVAEVAVVGTADDRWGETVVAVVVRKDENLTEDAVIEGAKSLLASYKKPTRVMFVDSLPRNAGMKVQKHVLREQLGL
ncbi:MAG: class I adenylate-forming enzyme family protein [Ilumatobacteraceae bacterium]